MILLLATSAEIELMKDMRTNEYLKSIHWMTKNIKYNIIFLETVKNENSFIEEYYPVFYSKSHNSKYLHGVNLGLALKSFCDSNKYDDDDLIIQTTARYHFIDKYFFEKIESNNDFDIYVLERDGPGLGEHQYFTGCFAIKYKYLVDWLNTTDWKYLNDNSINFEKSIYDYVKDKKLKVFNLDKVNMDCNIFANGALNRNIL